MKKSVAALIAGLLVGVALAMWLVQHRDQPQSGVTPQRTRESGGALAELHALEVATTQTGGTFFVVHVVRDGEAVSGARVAVHVRSGASWLAVGVELSDAHGDATFPARAGRSVVAVHSQAGVALELVNVPEARESTVVELRLGGRPVQGRVIDKETRAPIGGAFVSFSGLETGGLALPAELAVTQAADGLGRFKLLVPSFQEAQLQARAKGYSRGGVELSSMLPMADKDLELSRAATLAGEVVDESGAPVESATVSTRPEEDRATMTDARGHFELQVAPGWVLVHALGPNGLQATTRLEAPAGARTGVKLVLTSGSALEGFVHDSSEKPVSGVDVRLLAEPDDVEVAHLSTDTSGRFTARAIPEGRYSVAVRGEKGAHARVVGVEHPSAGRVDVRLIDTAALRGRVTSEAGQPLAGVMVEVGWNKGLNEPPRFARTGADGAFAFDGMLAGEVTLEASLGEVANVKRAAMLTSGQTSVVDLPLSRLGTLAGRVESVSGSKARWLVFVGDRHDGDRVNWTARTDESGAFSLKVPGGDYRLYPSSMHGRATHLDAPVRVDEETSVVLQVDDEGTWEDAGLRVLDMFSEVGTGVSFENSPGGVRVSFMMQDCPAAKAGVVMGDLLISVDGNPLRDSLDAFEKLRRPVGHEVRVTVRRDGVDHELALR